jgi:hypothetical protein
LPSYCATSPVNRELFDRVLMARIHTRSLVVLLKKSSHFIEIKMYSIPHLVNFMKTPLNFAEIASAQATSHEVFGTPRALKKCQDDCQF